jgi:hypothetical protein
MFKKPNARELAMRDPAKAALFGVIATAALGSNGSDFGADDYGFGDDEHGFGDDAGDDYGADAPSHAALARLGAHHHKKMRRGNKRRALLDPNEDSTVKVERYVFTLSQAITLGTAVAFTTLTGQPDTMIRPQRVVMNAPGPMFAFIQEIKVANVSVTVGTGLEDAFNYNANGVGQSLDMPTLQPSNKATVLGSYTGALPPGFVGGTSTYFAVSFKGPSTMAGG